MTYIILVAGKGAHLLPLTLANPKSLYKLDDDTTVLQRMVRTIRKFDNEAEIVVVVGFMYEEVQKEMLMENVKFIHNPFYAVTSSIASLWFAREYLQRENVTVINGDVVCEDKLVKDIICQHTDVPYVLIDTTVTTDGKYNVQVQDDKVCVMSRKLSTYSAVYASITKLDAVSARFVLETMEKMVSREMYNQFFEDVLVQMIFSSNFELYYKNVKDFAWIEVDQVDDLLKAKEIHLFQADCRVHP